jgi:hypothetical protein
MGRLSEFFRYLNTPTDRLTEFKKETSYIDIDRNKEKFKPIRRKHLSESKK